MSWLVAAGAYAAWGVLVGWRSGYRDPGAYAAFAAAAALAVGAAGRLVARLDPRFSPLDTGIRVAVVAVAIVVGCTVALGAAGHLTLGAVLAVEAAVCAAALVVGRRRVAVPDAGPPPLPAAPVAIVGALLAFALAFAAVHAPLTLYDSLSYHLFFAARWVQDHAIAIIPTPFSDEAQAYAPGNGEAFFAWLMLPFHGDLFARMGQLPFGLLAAAVLYALARRAGARPSHAIYPAAFFLLARPVVEQLVGANVDVICAAMFAAALYLGIAAVDSDRRADWALWGVALGLYWGTKYVALVYTPVFLLLAVARGPRWRAVWALPGIAAFALPWYARNWAIAGSPIYPASLTVAGVTIARGAFNRAAMLNSIFHTTDVRLFPAMAAHAMGPALIVFWAPFAVAGWIVLARRPWWPHRYLVLVPLGMVPLYWFGFPVNIDSRFLLPAVGPALLPLAFVFPSGRRGRTAIHVVFAVALIWLAVGLRANLPGTLPWFMGGWLTLNGVVTRSFVPWAAGTALAIAAVWHLARRRPSLAVPLVATSVALAASTLTVEAARCGETPCAYLDTTSPFIRPTYLEGWDWMRANVHGATVAYTGINLPYPLTGDRLTNRVVYVNIDGRLQWRFHDYDRAYRAGRFDPAPPLLAQSSGELMPVAHRTGPRDDAVRPRYERMDGIRDAWMFNLDRMDVRYLFVAALSAYEIDYVWHNESGFPIEDEWAKGDPGRFHLLYENRQVRIYAVDPARKVHA